MTSGCGPEDEGIFAGVDAEVDGCLRCVTTADGGGWRCWGMASRFSCSEEKEEAADCAGAAAEACFAVEGKSVFRILANRVGSWGAVGAADDAGVEGVDAADDVGVLLLWAARLAVVVVVRGVRNGDRKFWKRSSAGVGWERAKS